MINETALRELDASTVIDIEKALDIAKRGLLRLRIRSTHWVWLTGKRKPKQNPSMPTYFELEFL